MKWYLGCLATWKVRTVADKWFVTDCDFIYFLYGELYSKQSQVFDRNNKISVQVYQVFDLNNKISV